MSKRKARNTRRPIVPAQRKPGQPAKPRTRFWHNRKVWLAGATGTVVTGLATGVLINVLSAHMIATSPLPVLTLVSPIQVKAFPSTGTKPPAIRTGPPLTVVSEDPIELDNAGVWVFPGKVVLTPSQLKTINTPMDINNPTKSTYTFMNLLFSLGGYQAFPDTQLVVQNNQAQEVRILDMKIVKSCQAPLTGTLVYSPNAGGDPTIQLGFNLDSANTEAETWNPATGGWAPGYFAGHTVSIQPGAQQVFNIKSTTLKQSCTFRFLLTLLVGTQKTYQLVGDGGQPFRISAVTGMDRSDYSAYGVMYVGGVASPPGDHDRFVRVNPKTYPANYLPSYG